MSEEIERRPGKLDHDNSRLRYAPDVIERCLWEIAAAGGSCTKAQRALEEAGIEGPNGPIPVTTLQDWKKKTHRNRYHEILSHGVDRLEEEIAKQATARALELGDAEQRAIRQTLAGLSTANGVEASQILRNLSQSKQIQEQTAGRIRGRRVAEDAGRSLAEIAAELKRLAPNVIEVIDVEPVVDAEVVELAKGIEAGS